MAIFRGDVFSKTLPMEMGVTVIMPGDRLMGVNHEPAKVLYLLHGLTDNNSAWGRFTNIESYLHGKNVAVVMPDGNHGFYTDGKMSGAYFTYVSKELPSLIEDMFRISANPEDTYIGGLSMGGYGALKCILTYPERYAGCAAFSSLMDIKEYIHSGDVIAKRIGNALFGEGKEPTDCDDLFKLAEKCADDGKKLPEIYMSCGKGDVLYRQNVRFAEHLKALKIDSEFDAWEGIHDWKFWNEAIQKAIKKFFG